MVSSLSSCRSRYPSLFTGAMASTARGVPTPVRPLVSPPARQLATLEPAIACSKEVRVRVAESGVKPTDWRTRACKTGRIKRNHPES